MDWKENKKRSCGCWGREKIFKLHVIEEIEHGAKNLQGTESFRNKPLLV